MSRQIPAVRSSARQQGVSPLKATPSHTVASLRKLLPSQNDWKFKGSSCKKVEVEGITFPGPSPAVLSDNCLVTPNVKVANREATECTEEYHHFVGETGALRKLFLESSVCRHCRKGNLDVTFDTVGIGTVVQTKCDFPDCGSRCRSSIEGTSLEKGKHRRTSDWAINIQCVLAMMLSGDGGAEAGRMLGMMDLPHNSSMEKDTFPKIESELSKHIQQYTKELLENKILEEVALTYKNNQDFDYDSWENAWRNKLECPIDKMPKIKCSYDMGWTKRSSGKRYDSHSGHAATVGVCTRKALSLAVLSKFCSICSKNGENADEHECTKNFTGSSGSMEPAALVQMAHELYLKYYVILGVIVADDDSSIRAQMKWSNAHWSVHHGKKAKRPDRGKLMCPHPEPKFLADPAHRKKTLGKELCGLAGSKKSVSKGVNKLDALKLTKNYAYMIRQLPHLSKELWLLAAKAVLDHHFEIHSGCGDWCQ